MAQKPYRNKDLLIAIGSRIRHFRVTKGMTQEQLANDCELEISQINRIELGKINTSISHLHLISKALGTSLAEIVTVNITS